LDTANAVSEAIKSGGYWSAHAEESITSPACLLLYGGALFGRAPDT
jgi:hypothetical protein